MRWQIERVATADSDVRLHQLSSIYSASLRVAAAARQEWSRGGVQLVAPRAALLSGRPSKAERRCVNRCALIQRASGSRRNSRARVPGSQLKELSQGADDAEMQPTAEIHANEREVEEGMLHVWQRKILVQASSFLVQRIESRRRRSDVMRVRVSISAASNVIAAALMRHRLQRRLLSFLRAESCEVDASYGDLPFASCMQRLGECPIKSSAVRMDWYDEERRLEQTQQCSSIIRAVSTSACADAPPGND